MILPDPQKLRVELYPNPILKKVCTPIDRFGDELQRFAEGMIELMLNAKGVGLAERLSTTLPPIFIVIIFTQE